MDETSGRDKGGAGKPGQSVKSPDSEGSRSRPAFTERQRKLAREARARHRKRRRSPGAVLSTGLRATWVEIGRAFAFIGGVLAGGLRGLGAIGLSILEVLFAAAELTARGVTRVLSALAAAVAAIARAAARLDRALKPTIVTAVVAVAAAVALIASQFLDFRAIEIGQPGYEAVADLTRAPRTGVETPIASHSVLLIAIGGIALVAAAATLAGRRRPLPLVVAGCGLATVAVTLAIDLPGALDLGDAGVAYAGASAVLLPGFWLQLAAGVTLATTGILLSLGREVDRAEAPRPRRRPADRSSTRTRAART